MQKITLRNGLTALLMTISLTGCGNTNSDSMPTVQTVPHYTPAQIESVIRDQATCGPAAKKALDDWATMIGA